MKMNVKNKLTDILWKSGFRSLLFGFLLLNVFIFIFFFIRINILYDTLTTYTVKIAKLSQEFIQEKESKLLELSENNTSEISDILNYHQKIAQYTISPQSDMQIKQNIKESLERQLGDALKKYAKENTVQGALVIDARGAILSKFGFEQHSFIEPDLLKELNSLSVNQYKFAISKDGMHLFKRLNTEYQAFLFLFKKMNVHIFKDFIQFQDLYSKAKVFKTDLYVLIIVVFIALIALFLFFSLVVVRMLSNKIMSNLQTLLHLSENLKKDGDVILMPDVEIKEFQEIMYILYANLEELHSVNKNLHDQNTFTQEILDNVSNGIILLNKEYQVLLINAYGAKILNTDIESKKTIFDIFPELVPSIKAYDQQQDNQGTHVIKNIDKNLNRFLAHISKISDKFLITFEDITYQISLQKQAAWRDVARVIAHEVKNPLTPTRLCAEQLLYSTKLTEEKRKQYLQTIINNVEHVNKLITDFTDFTKQVQQNLQTSMFSLKELLEEICEMQKLMFTNVHFNLIAHEDIKIQADQKQIMQALNNLIQNAAQAFDEKQEDANVVIDYILKDGLCTITIDDNGQGIKGDVEKMFQPYMTTKSYGTGLGLVVVRKIAQAHGGNVILEKKEKGVKAIFSLRF